MYCYFVLILFLSSSIVNDLPPTPSKFHYIFNLRDLSRIYHGMCLTTPDRFCKVENFVRVWRNECLRVIGDRLISDVDKEIVNVSQQLGQILNNMFFGHNFVYL